ncbi:MAG: patatin-like phospholipase family protein [Syntrophobacteraceae bacterium]
MPESLEASSPVRALRASRGDLVFLAGRKALATIRECGLDPEMVKVVVGAAGGPKWLILSELDRILFPHWLAGRSEPLYLLGSSIGAWRFAAAAHRSPSEATARLQDAYLGHGFNTDMRPHEATRFGIGVLGEILGTDGARQILAHKHYRLSIMAARCKWPVASDNKLLLSLGLFDAAIYNAFHRNGLQFFFERALFFDPRDTPPFAAMDDFPTLTIPLSPNNLKHALLASGSIPFTMCKVRNIPGAPEGTYRDGGVIDYHMDIPFLKNGDGVVLFPHYVDRIVPGWFDKSLPWRSPKPSNLDHVLLVAPSREFIARLPLKKIPDRNDFRRFKGHDEDRIAYWKAVVEESRRLADLFWDLVQTNRIRERIEPLPGSS